MIYSFKEKRKIIEDTFPDTINFKSVKSNAYKKYFLFKLLSDIPIHWDKNELRDFHLFSKKALCDFIGKFGENPTFYKTFMKFIQYGTCDTRTSFEKIIIIFSPIKIKKYSSYDERKDSISDDQIIDARNNIENLRRKKKIYNIEDKRLNVYKNEKFYMDGEWNIITLFASKLFLESSFLSIKNGLVTATGQNGKEYKGYAVVFNKNFLHINFIKFIKDGIEEDFYASYQIKVHSFGSDAKPYYNGFRLLKSATVDRSYVSRCALMSLKPSLGNTYKKIALFPFEEDSEGKLQFNEDSLTEYNSLLKDKKLNEIFHFLQTEENNLMIGFQEPGRSFINQSTNKSIREINYGFLFYNSCYKLIRDLEREEIQSEKDEFKNRLKKALFCLNKASMHGFNGSKYIKYLKEEILDTLNLYIDKSEFEKYRDDISNVIKDIIIFKDEYFYIKSKFNN